MSQNTEVPQTKSLTTPPPPLPPKPISGPASTNSSPSIAVDSPRISIDQPSNANKRRHLGWAPPTLYIPPAHSMPGAQPQAWPTGPAGNHQIGPPAPLLTPKSAQPSTLGGSSLHRSGIGEMGHSFYPYLDHKKASEFMFNQFNGIRDFTMSTAKSGLGMGEKISFWLYNKISAWSKKWFTHIFLSIVLLIYTVGGALIFQTLEGTNEQRLVVVDMRLKRRVLIEDLRQMAKKIPEEQSLGEWHGAAVHRLQTYEDYIIEAYKNHQLIVSNHGTKIWTFWNAVVYCSTIYTTIGKMVLHFIL